MPSVVTACAHACQAPESWLDCTSHLQFDSLSMPESPQNPKQAKVRLQTSLVEETLTNPRV